MKNRLFVFTFILVFFAPSVFSRGTASPPKIRLAVILVFDQFRADYLSRFEKNFLPSHPRNGQVGGFRYLVEQGAYFADCRYDHYPLYTAPGHAVISTGGEPYKTHIVGNEWYDADQNMDVGAVEDFEFGQSPRHLASTTIGDELKLATHRKSKVIALSLKDRAAILLGGFDADAVLWLDEKSRIWTTSSFYSSHLPAWAENFNQTIRPRFPASYEALTVSPKGNEMTFAMAETAIVGEKLGNHETPDFLAVNFASTDYVGHKYGPFSPEVKKMTIQTDRRLSEFLKFLQCHVPGGLNSILIVATSDHGVAWRPETLQTFKIPATRIDPEETKTLVENALLKRFGASTEGPWVEDFIPPYLYFNPKKARLNPNMEPLLEYYSIQALETQPWAQAVYGRAQIQRGQLPHDAIAEAVERSFSPNRSGDLVIVPKAGDFWSGKTSVQTEHLTPYPYDTHVPLIMMGPGIKTGLYTKPVKPKDIAPTLSYLLKTEMPSACEGKILTEALK